MGQKQPKYVAKGIEIAVPITALAKHFGFQDG